MGINGSVLAQALGNLGQGWLARKDKMREDEVRDEELRSRRAFQDRQMGIQESQLARMLEQLAMQQEEAEEARRMRDAMAQQNAATLEARRRALRALGVPDEQVEALAGDEVAFRDRVKPQEPKPPMRGTPEYLKMLEDEKGVESRFAPPRAPVMGSPEWREAIDFQASTAAKYRPTPASSAERPMTEAQRKAGAFLLMAEDANAVLDELEASGKKVPSLREKVGAQLGRDAGNYLTSDEYRRMQSAGLALSDAWLRYTSGAAVPETEVERFAKGFLPSPGDDDVTLADKKRRREKIVDALRQGKGKAGDVGTDMEAQLQQYLRRQQEEDE